MTGRHLPNIWIIQLRPESITLLVFTLLHVKFILKIGIIQFV